LAEFELALQLNPNFSLAHGYYGLALTYCGRWQEASKAAQHALRQSPRDPFSAIYYGVAAYAQFVGKNYHEAIGLSREAIRQRSDFAGAYRVLTVAAGMAGQIEVAGAALKELRRAQPNLARLDRQPVAMEAGLRPRALFGGLPQGGLGLTSGQRGQPPGRSPARQRGHRSRRCSRARVFAAASRP
jgi:tetratricopeptide (TPR) repeat protein